MNRKETNGEGDDDGVSTKKSRSMIDRSFVRSFFERKNERKKGGERKERKKETKKERKKERRVVLFF